jgi:PhoPQ-activated pathogenicity-related protein
VRNKAMVEGCNAEAFICKEIMNFSNKFFSHTNNMNAHTMQYHIVKEVPLSELSIFQWKGKGVRASNAHYVTDEEWNYIVLYMHMNMEEVQPYFDMFNKIYWKRSEQPTLKQLDSMR